MAKLTKMQQKRIFYALCNLERARAYLFNPRLAIAKRDSMATTALHYARADGQCLYEVERAYGSDLTGLDNGIAELKLLLTNQGGHRDRSHVQRMDEPRDLARQSMGQP